MKFLLALLVAGAVFAEPQSVQWKRSDALGNDLGPAPLAKSARAEGWTLRLEIRGSTEERVLFDKGVEQSTRLIDRDLAGRALRVRDLRGGEPVWEVTYHPETGLPSTETTFSDGQPSQISQLTFENRVLVRREVKDAEGGVLYTDQLFRWPDGSLRRVERDGPSGPLAEAAWSYGSGRLTLAWAAGEADKALGRHREWTYSPGLTNEVLATETQTLLTRVSEAGDAGGKETLTDAEGRVEIRTTDLKGKVTGEMVTVKGTLVQVRRWTYDGQGRVVEASTESAGAPETWAYTYNEDGTVLGRLLRAGLLVKETVTRDGETVTVRLYDRGSLFLVEDWAAGRRIKETYYKNGAIIRERTP